MLQKFVILKAASGEPLKRLFITSEDKEIIIGDPERLAEIKSGEDGISCVSYERVFNFEEDAYLELVREWEAAKATRADVWTRLGHIALPNEDDHSCPFWC